MASGSTEAGFGAYLRQAFMWKWNLLGFGGALAAALISGIPAVTLPIVLAGELMYIGTIMSFPKFRKAIDAQEHKAQALPENGTVAPTRSRLEIVMDTLNRDRSFRFTALRARCVEMQKIAAGVRGHSGDTTGDDLHTSALDKMLWVFVRLLASQEGLDKFLETTDALAIKRRVTELETRIKKAEKNGNTKILRALVDSVSTAQLRVDNLQTAEHNAEFVEIELDRIEDKIKALVEMAVSHEDPDFISSQVDSVAASVLDTEQAMREMSFIPGVNDGIEEEEEESAPSILSVSA